MGHRGCAGAHQRERSPPAQTAPPKGWWSRSACIRSMRATASTCTIALQWRSAGQLPSRPLSHGRARRRSIFFGATLPHLKTGDKVDYRTRLCMRQHFTFRSPARRTAISRRPSMSLPERTHIIKQFAPRTRRRFFFHHAAPHAGGQRRRIRGRAAGRRRMRGRARFTAATASKGSFSSPDAGRLPACSSRSSTRIPAHMFRSRPRPPTNMDATASTTRRRQGKPGRTFACASSRGKNCSVFRTFATTPGRTKP